MKGAEESPGCATGGSGAAATARSCHTSRRRHVTVVLLAGIVMTTASLLAAAPPVALGARLPGAPHGARRPARAPTTYYLAIGASESVGYQPVAGRPRGAPTARGYANDLLARERARWPGLRLVQVGCPGESAVAAVRGGGPCAYPAGSQLATALRFLSAHAPATVLVTVDLGFNDVRTCLAHRSVRPRCVAHALAGIRRVLPRALSRLRAVGGPRMRIVGLEHPDPYVARFLGRRRGRVFAAASLHVFDRLNSTLGRVYRAAGASVADVPRVYGTAGGRLAITAVRGHVPVSVARDCAYTWMCRPGPHAGNIHPNARGYRAIAGAVASAVGRARTVPRRGVLSR